MKNSREIGDYFPKAGASTSDKSGPPQMPQMLSRPLSPLIRLRTTQIWTSVASLTLWDRGIIPVEPGTKRGPDVTIVVSPDHSYFRAPCGNRMILVGPIPTQHLAANPGVVMTTQTWGFPHIEMYVSMTLHPDFIN